MHSQATVSHGLRLHIVRYAVAIHAHHVRLALVLRGWQSDLGWLDIIYDHIHVCIASAIRSCEKMSH